MIEAVAPYLVLAACAAPWLVLVGRRFGHVLGALAVLAAAPLVVLISFHVSLLLGGDPVWVTLGFALAAGIAGTLALARRRRVPSQPSSAALATWLSACAGLVAWVATVIIAPLLSGSVRGWAMRGDAGNNVRISRDMLENHGYPLTQLQAVPLPNELLAIAGWFGRGGSRAEVFAHDLYALAAFTALSIGATGILLAVVASSLIPVTRVARSAVVGSIASLACTTWFVSGLPIESGFVNIPATLPFVLASWLAFVQARRHPLAAALVLLALSAVILASWSPLVTVPGGLLVALLVRHRHSPRISRGPLPVIALVVCIIGLSTAVAALLPSMLSFTSLLSSSGNGFPSTIPVLATALAVAVVAAARAPRRAVDDVRDGVVALAISLTLGLVVLIALNAHQNPPWLAYYPAKYAFFASVLVAAVAISLLVAHLDAMRGRWATAACALVVAGAVVASTLGPAPLRENVRIEQPLAHILADTVWTQGEESVETIIEYNARPEIELQWGMGSADEAAINFWALEFKGFAPGQGNEPTRSIIVTAYRSLRDTGSYVTPAVSQLCALVRAIDRPVLVHTHDVELDSEVARTCPELPIDVTVDP